MRNSSFSPKPTSAVAPGVISRPIRWDYLDELVWQQVMELLKNSELIHAEVDRRFGRLVTPSAALDASRSFGSFASSMTFCGTVYYDAIGLDRGGAHGAR